MKYAIAILTQTAGGNERVYFFATDTHMSFSTLSLGEANKIAQNLTVSPYVLSRNEFSRPLYYIIPSDVAHYIATQRNNNYDNYDWYTCECESERAFCRVCDICTQHIIDSDRNLTVNSQIEID